MSENKCVICSEIIPEGIQVCPKCENNDTYMQGYSKGVRDFANKIRSKDATYSINEIERELL